MVSFTSVTFTSVIERVYEYLYLDDIGGDGRGGGVHSYGLMIELVRAYNDGNKSR